LFVPIYAERITTNSELGQQKVRLQSPFKNEDHILFLIISYA